MPDSALSHRGPGTPSDPELVEAPIAVSLHLRGARFPATHDELVQCAKENDAPEAVVIALDALHDEYYESLEALCEALRA